MKKRSLCLAVLLATVTSSGCASYLLPSAGGYGRYAPVRRTPMAVVDPAMAARGRWDSVMRLPRGAVIDVLTFDGVAHVGEMSSADGYVVRVAVHGIDEQIARPDVLRIDLVDLPLSFGGAQPQILRFQAAPVHAMPPPIAGPPPVLSQRPLVALPGPGRPAICHRQAMPLRQ